MLNINLSSRRAATTPAPILPQAQRSAFMDELLTSIEIDTIPKTGKSTTPQKAKSISKSEVGKSAAQQKMESVLNPKVGTIAKSEQVVSAADVAKTAKTEFEKMMDFAFRKNRLMRVPTVKGSGGQRF